MTISTYLSINTLNVNGLMLQKTQGDGMDKIARPGAQVNVSGGRKQRRWGLLVKFGLGTLLVNHGE